MTDNHAQGRAALLAQQCFRVTDLQKLSIISVNASTLDWADQRKQKGDSMSRVRCFSARIAILWISMIAMTAAAVDLSESAMLRFLSHPPSVKEIAFRWDGRKGNFQGVLYGVFSYHSNGCFFARYAGDQSEFSNSFVYPKTKMYAQTATGYWRFGHPLSSPNSEGLLDEWVVKPETGATNTGSSGIGVLNEVTLGSAQAFYSFCYGIPRLKDVSINESNATFSGTPWCSALGLHVSGRIIVDQDHRFANVAYVATHRFWTNSFSVRCIFPLRLTDGLLVPSKLIIRRAVREHDEEELATEVWIERVVAGTPDVHDFRAKAHYLLGMNNHRIIDTGLEMLPIKVDPQVEAAFAALAKGPPAEQLLRETEARAASEHKAVFVHFGASWCGPCKQLDAVLERPDIKAVFDHHFVSVKVVISESMANKAQENPGATKLYQELGGVGGIPFYAFVNSDGTLIANSNSPEEENIRYPDDAQAEAWFLNIVRKAAPHVSDRELETIRTGLRAAKRR